MPGPDASAPSLAPHQTQSPAYDFDLCVIGGLGHVGLPLSVTFARKGHKVIIYDINETAARTVESGVMPFLEENGDAFLREALDSGNLAISANIEAIRRARILAVVIGTPVDDHLNPELNRMLAFLEEVFPYVHDGQIFMMRSTVYPGTTELVREFFLRRGRKIRVTFCPERIAEGYAFKETTTMPQIVSGFDPQDVEEMHRLFKAIGSETIELTPLEAELGKLFTNVWRYCQFAVSNQFYMIANAYNLDYYRILDAIRYKYPRLAGMPGAGLTAGPCLFKDTLQLAAFNNNIFGLGYAAMTTNEGLPNHMVAQLKSHTSLKDKTVGILGMAFKANSDDPRGSLSYKLRRILTWEAREVLCTDVYIHDPEFVAVEELVERSDIIVLATPHREYRNLDVQGKVVLDVWNFYGQGGLVFT